MLVRRFSVHSCLAVVCLVLSATLATAQTNLDQPLPVLDDLAVVMEQGALLERERRWAEALSHYEDALRQHPDRPLLQQRVSEARAHYDVCRRYTDQSYARALGTLTERDALAIYDEVLLKVQSHYVNEPKWQRLVQSGQTSVEAAVTEPAFVARHLATTPVESLTALQRDVRDLVGARAVADRKQATEVVQSTATTLR